LDATCTNLDKVALSYRFSIANQPCSSPPLAPLTDIPDQSPIPQGEDKEVETKKVLPIARLELCNKNNTLVLLLMLMLMLLQATWNWQVNQKGFWCQILQPS
jgi:hypothetical protein